MTMERNEKGQLLANINELAEQAAGARFSRYNGGWIKTVTGLDKAKTNGYSITGEFIRGGGPAWLDPGLYLDCSIDGSRHYPDRRYTLFALRPDGTVEALATAQDHRGWAVDLWPAITDALAAMDTPEEQAAAKVAELVARRDKLRAELELIEDQLALLAGAGKEDANE